MFNRLVSVIIIFSVAIASFVAGFALIFTSIWALADESQHLNRGRRIVQGQGISIPGMWMTYTTPFIFGAVRIIPLLLAILLYASKSVKVFERSLVILIIVSIMLFIIELPCTIAPIALTLNETNNQYRDAMIKFQTSEYRGLPWSWSENRELSLLWDIINIDYTCCGVGGSADFTLLFNTRSAAWYTSSRSYTLSNTSSYSGSQVQIPTTCCNLNDKTAFLQRKDYVNIQSYLLSEPCPLTAQFSHAAFGCYDTLWTNFYNYTLAIFFSLLANVLMILVIAIAACYISVKKPHLKIDDYSYKDKKIKDSKPPPLYSYRRDAPLPNYTLSNQLSRY